MSTENEQFRPGFEAWAIGPTGPYGGKVWLRRKDGQYVEDCVEARWQGWLAAKRDASTEPSYNEGAHAVDLMKHFRAKAAGKGYVAIESAIDAAPVLSAALPDEAIDAARNYDAGILEAIALNAHPCDGDGYLMFISEDEALRAGRRILRLKGGA